MVRGRLPAPLFGTREGAFSSPEHERMPDYLISCGTRQRKPSLWKSGTQRWHLPRTSTQAAVRSRPGR